MTWFKVDDSFHSHPKVLATPPAALGLWVVAGAWCGANLTDGFVPDHVLPRLLPDSVTLADQLVSTGLWKRVRGGYRFHDWGDYNPNRTAVEKEREAARQRMRNLRENRKNAARGASRSPEHGANVRDLFGGSSQPRPVPSRPEGTGVSVGDSSSGSRRPRENEDDLDLKIEKQIAALLLEETGRRISPERAARVRQQLLDDRDVKNPTAYVAKAIRSDPARYLPGDVHPSDRTVAEAIAAARGEA